ncbi:MAG: hypothetical protein LLH30_18015 [Candidatus Manganitrophus sp. SA1]|nr:hypothetical protein [Candidatus Manganitrophus morganii]
MYRLYLFGFFLAVTIVQTVYAGDTALIRLPSTTFGPSGLLFTQSTNTLSPGEVEIGVGFAHEHSSNNPDYTINEISATVTVGILPWAEVSARVPYMYSFESHGIETDGVQGGELSLKWRFLNQEEDFSLPAMGASLTYFSPVDSKVSAFDVVDSWGVKGLFLASAEVDISPSLHYAYHAGLYANAGIFIRDLGKSTEERHGLLDLGMALPLSPSRQIQLIFEANTTLRNEIPLQGNYTGLTAALRYVTSSFQLTGGMQRRLKQDDEDVEIEDTNPDRFILYASYLF